MATGPSIKYQIPVKPDTKCELCEENEIQWKCFTCTEYQHICNVCAKVHLKSEHTRNHRVTSMRDSEKQYGQQENESAKCNLHLTEDVQIYCKPCDTPICHDCLASGSHQHHKLVKFDDVMDSKHRQLQELSTENEWTVARYETSIVQTQRQQKEFIKDIEQRTEEIKNRNTQLKAKLDQFTNHAIAQLQEREKQQLQILKCKEKELETKKKEITKLGDECKANLPHRTVKMIQFTTKLKQELDNYKLCDPPEPIKCPDFVYQDVSDQEFMKIFGHLNISSLNVLPVIQKLDEADFTPIADAASIKSSSINKNTEVPAGDYTNPVETDATPTTCVRVIKSLTLNKNILVPASDDRVWMGKFGYKGISLVTINGDVVQTVKTDFYVYDLAVTKSDEVLATDYNGNKIKKLKPNNKFTDLYTLPTGHKTFGITVTDNNSIVVCLYSSDKKEGKIVELSSSGQLINTIQYQRDGRTPLFDEPFIVSNRNGDLIVATFAKNNKKVVVAVDREQNKKFTYTGQVAGLKEPFYPQCIVTDQYGCILISDFDNNAIHILDRDGNFIKCIRTDEYGAKAPKGICIDKFGGLWISSSVSKKIIVIKYP